MGKSVRILTKLQPNYNHGIFCNVFSIWILLVNLHRKLFCFLLKINLLHNILLAYDVHFA